MCVYVCEGADLKKKATIQHALTYPSTYTHSHTHTHTHSAILKYAFPIRIDEVILDAAGNVSELKATADQDNTGPKPKGAITWVPTNTDTHTHTHAIPTEFRLYNHLFTVETPGDDTWEQELNPHSLETKGDGWVDASVCVCVNGGGGGGGAPTMPAPFTTFQLERQGYFTVDPDTTTEKLVLNRVVTLKESSVKKEVVSSGGLDAKAKNRKEEQARQLAEKEVGLCMCVCVFVCV